MYLENKERIYIDANVSDNIFEINNFDRSTNVIIKSLLIYFSYSFLHPTDLFGYRLLDIDDFAKEMGFTASNLKRKNPNCISNDKDFQSYIGNALYILLSTTLLKSYNYKEGNFDVKRIENFIFLNSCEILKESRNKGRTKKILFRYKPDIRFEENIKQYHINSQLELFKLAKSKKVEDLFLNTIHWYQKSKKSEVFFSLHQLKEYFNINTPFTIENLKHIKQSAQRKVKIAIEILSRKISDISYEWIQKDNKLKGKNVLRIYWIKEETSEDIRKEIKRSFFKNILKRELFEYFKKELTKEVEDNEEGFIFWLKDKKNEIIIQEIYKRENRNVYGKTSKINNVKNMEQMMARSFYKKLIHIKNINEINIV